MKRDVTVACLATVVVLASFAMVMHYRPAPVTVITQTANQVNQLSLNQQALMKAMAVKADIKKLSDGMVEISKKQADMWAILKSLDQVTVKTNPVVVMPPPHAEPEDKE